MVRVVGSWRPNRKGARRAIAKWEAMVRKPDREDRASVGMSDQARGGAVRLPRAVLVLIEWAFRAVPTGDA
ncbi:MAG TPA: hypothetical protein ENJ50_03660 [Planctomycetaceae bacterium]|nr:hypothetical protein [Planctomycetaceae bacterium]